MLIQKYHVTEIGSSLDTFSPFDLAEIDKKYLVRVARFKGIFPWHTHPKDEFFLVLKGKIILETKKSKIVLSQGECIKLNHGIEHRPYAKEDAIVLTVLSRAIKTSKHDFPEVADKL